jgi:hypothetical protein
VASPAQHRTQQQQAHEGGQQRVASCVLMWMANLYTINVQHQLNGGSQHRKH